MKRWQLLVKFSGGTAQYAADGGYAPRFLSVFVALSFFLFEGEQAIGRLSI